MHHPIAQANVKASKVSKVKPKQARTDRARKRAKERLDEAIEEGLKETFPGSDPVAVIEPARERPNLRLDGSHRRLSRAFRGQQARLLRVTSVVADFAKTRVRSVKSLWLDLEPRWAAACGAWFGALLAVLLGLTDWRVAVMAAATAFMLARAGDMPDDY